MSTQPRLKDKDIREPLFDYLEDQFGKIRIIEEKMMGRSRADVIMVTEDALVGLEIKSDADTYARLARQVKDYERYYDFNYVVAGTSHAMHIEEHVPASWGIITVEWAEQEKLLDFYLLRRAARNEKVDLEAKMHILWRPELAHIQSLNMMPKYAGKNKRYVVRQIIETVPRDQLQKQISEELFERDYTVIEETLEAYRSSHRPAAGRRKSRSAHRRSRKTR